MIVGKGKCRLLEEMMKCKQCKCDIGFEYFLFEAINPFKRSWHKCPSCGLRYKIKNHSIYLIMLYIGFMKAYKYWMQNVEYILMSFEDSVRCSVWGWIIIYLFYVAEQIIIYELKKNN